MTYALKCEMGTCNRESSKEVKALFPDTGNWDQFSVCEAHYQELIHTLPATSVEIVARRKSYF